MIHGTAQAFTSDWKKNAIGCLHHSVRTRAPSGATCGHVVNRHTYLLSIVTSFPLWRLAPTALADPVLIMTSFSLRRRSLLSWPRPALQTYGHHTAF